VQAVSAPYAEFFHLGVQRRRLETEEYGCTARSADTAFGLPQRADDR
jgi:hypothetical protein